MSKETQVPQFQRKQALAVPQLKLTLDKPAFIQIDSGITKKETNDPKMKEMSIVTVIDLETGEPKQLILDQIPLELFTDFGDELIGKRFEVTKGKKVAGRTEGSNGYYPYTIYELA